MVRLQLMQAVEPLARTLLKQAAAGVPLPPVAAPQPPSTQPSPPNPVLSAQLLPPAVADVAANKEDARAGCVASGQQQHNEESVGMEGTGEEGSNSQGTAIIGSPPRVLTSEHDTTDGNSTAEEGAGGAGTSASEIAGAGFGGTSHRTVGQDGIHFVIDQACQTILRMLQPPASSPATTMASAFDSKEAGQKLTQELLLLAEQLSQTLGDGGNDGGHEGGGLSTPSSDDSPQRDQQPEASAEVPFPVEAVTKRQPVPGPCATLDDHSWPRLSFALRGVLQHAEKHVAAAIHVAIQCSSVQASVVEAALCSALDQMQPHAWPESLFLPVPTPSATARSGTNSDTNSDPNSSAACTLQTANPTHPLLPAPPSTRDEPGSRPRTDPVEAAVAAGGVWELPLPLGNRLLLGIAVGVLELHASACTAANVWDLASACPWDLEAASRSGGSQGKGKGRAAAAAAAVASEVGSKNTAQGSVSGPAASATTAEGCNTEADAACTTKQSEAGDAVVAVPAPLLKLPAQLVTQATNSNNYPLLRRVRSCLQHISQAGFGLAEGLMQ